PQRMKMWVSDSRQELEISIPLLGRYRPAAGRCCQTCTPKSWVRARGAWAGVRLWGRGLTPACLFQDGLYDQQLSSLGFRDVVRVTEKDTRYRGWLVRRICGFLAAWGWKIPAD
ncbi:GPAT2 acyltransferase, partial [Rhinopomastus cyanomelas]|nr:GPAT2 acyltransferase [Rhinopomastus cyanomelas]